jgi:hypothetical protein
MRVGTGNLILVVILLGLSSQAALSQILLQVKAKIINITYYLVILLYILICNQSQKIEFAS